MRRYAEVRRKCGNGNERGRSKRAGKVMHVAVVAAGSGNSGVSRIW